MENHDEPNGVPKQCLRHSCSSRAVVGFVACSLLDMSVADALAEALQRPRLIIDTTQVTFIDSTGTSCLRHPLEASESLIHRSSSQVERLLELSGL